MKWFTHQCLAVGTAAALGMPLPAVAGALAGAVLPDVVDHRLAALSPRPRRTFNRIHRGASHWFGWYLALWLLSLAAPSPLPGLKALEGLGGLAGAGQGALLFFLGGAAYGALTHVLLDMLTPMGAPLTPFSRKRKLSLNVCVTGGIGEYVFLGLSLAGLWLLAGDRLGGLPRFPR